jgi:PAS domain S-box-containing protein
VREVSCKASRPLLDAVECDVDLNDLVAGLPVTLAELRDTSNRIGWDVFVELLARIDAKCGPIEEIGARIVKVPSFELLWRGGRLFFSAKQLYDLGVRFVAPALFPVVMTGEWHPSGQAIFEFEILPGYRDSIHFVRICIGNIVATPMALNLPPSKVIEQTYDARSARLVLLPPASHTLLGRVKRSARALRSLGAVVRGIEAHENELRESRAALAISRNEMKQLIERLPDGVLIHREGIVRWVNAAMLEILGVSRTEDVIGRSVVELVPPEERAALAARVQRAMRDDTDPHPEYTVVRPDGARRRLQSGVAQAVELDGEKVRMVVLRDVTEERRMREQAAITERLAALGALAAGVGHEINNPLAYVRLSLDIIAREAAAPGGASSPQLRSALANAVEGTDRVLGIVRHLSTFSRVHDESVGTVDVRALLESTLGLAERVVGAKARIVRNYAPVPMVRAARGKLGQVLLNLLTNAADAIPEGSPGAHEIRVATRVDDAGRVVLEIADTGRGIPREIAGRVFDPFFTTKPVGSGTGLGLTICHRIVTELGGRLEFDSVPGATAFRVLLPLAPPDSIEPADGAARNTPDRASPRRRVLVVDDEPALLSVIRALLQDRHDVVTASGARQALAILDDEPRFDAILADLMMGDLTGMDFYDAVRRRHPGLESCFVFMTGGAYSVDARTFLAHTPNRCLEKPFAREELLDAIDVAVHAAAV